MFEKLKISIAKLLLMQKIKLALIHSVRLKKKNNNNNNIHDNSCGDSGQDNKALRIFFHF